jgi:hypothetical protein
VGDVQANGWREAVDAFDPLHEALALGNNWLRSPKLAGRGRGK